MRLLIFVGFLGLFAFTGSNKQTERSSTFIEKDSLQAKIADKISFNNFNNQDIASVKFDSINTRIKNITYSEEYLDKDNELDYYIVKKSQEITTTHGAEGQDSKITLDFFSLKNGELIKTITKETDAISISNEYLLATKYGCCGTEDYNELSSIWTNETFLKYNSKYYYIEIPNAHTGFYLGFLCDARDEKELILGELYFAQSLPTLPAGKRYYSSVFKNVNKIVFKAMTQEVFDKIVPFTPTMTLVKNTDKDELIEYPNHQELRLWSYDNVNSLAGVDFLGLKIQFEGDSISQTPIDIPIKNGLLFGDNKIESTIYVEN